MAGVGKLFEQFKIEGYEPAYAKLKEQLAAWDEFVKSEVLPKAREDFRMPPELYAFQLEQIGIDIPPASSPPRRTRRSPRSRARCRTSPPRSPGRRVCHLPTTAT